MAQICRTMVAFAARASALQAWNTWIVPDTIRQSTRIHRVRAPACGRRTYLHRNRAWGIVKWPHVITATDARGEAAGPARRNSRRRSGSVPGRPRRCQIFGGGPVGRAGLLARNRGISIVSLNGYLVPAMNFIRPFSEPRAKKLILRTTILISLFSTIGPPLTTTEPRNAEG